MLLNHLPSFYLLLAHLKTSHIKNHRLDSHMKSIDIMESDGFVKSSTEYYEWPMTFAIFYIESLTPWSPAIFDIFTYFLRL